MLVPVLGRGFDFLSLSGSNLARVAQSCARALPLVIGSEEAYAHASRGEDPSHDDSI
jgi:hypothetical protein